MGAAGVLEGGYLVHEDFEKGGDQFYHITGNLSPIVASILMPVSSVSLVAFATFVTRATGRFKQP